MAVAESFFQLLIRERVRRKVYATRDDAKQDVFDYIEMFYNSKRRHSFNEQLSQVEFKKRHFLRRRVPRKIVAIHWHLAPRSVKRAKQSCVPFSCRGCLLLRLGN